jgi:hypothetical protein
LEKSQPLSLPVGSAILVSWLSFCGSALKLLDPPVLENLFSGTDILFVTGLSGGSRCVCPFWFPDQFIPTREDSGHITLNDSIQAR